MRACRAPVPEKGIGKSDSKYAVMIKSCGGGVAEDGYKWRKYGQKTIKNNPNPRFFLLPPMPISFRSKINNMFPQTYLYYVYIRHEHKYFLPSVNTVRLPNYDTSITRDSVPIAVTGPQV